MIHITEKKLRAAIQVSLGNYNDIYSTLIESDLVYSIKALAKESTEKENKIRDQIISDAYNKGFNQGKYNPEML